MIVIHGSSRALGFEYNSVLLNLQHALKVKSEYVKIMVLPAVRNLPFFLMPSITVLPKPSSSMACVMNRDLNFSWYQ